MKFLILWFVAVLDPASQSSTAALRQLGMDMQLLDSIENRRPLLASERDCFYALFAAAGRAKPYELETAALSDLKRTERIQFDVAPLFNSPASQAGRLVTIEGDARRAIEIRVDNSEIVRRFNIRRYYEIAIFTDDSQGNPLICCVLEAPKEMPLGEDIFAQVRVAGFFMKSWAYPRGDVNSADAKQQLAPLILGREARLLTPAASIADSAVNVLVVGGVLIAIAGILWAAWRAGRPSLLVGDRQQASPPDFSGLE